MSTAAAPVARRSSALAAAVRTGASEAAKRSTTTRAPASMRRCASDDVTASSVLTAPSSETTSAPRMRSPGRSRGSSPPHRPQLTTSDGRRSADFGQPGAQGSRVAAERHAPWSGQDRRLPLQSADDQEACSRLRGSGGHRLAAGRDDGSLRAFLQ